MGDPIDGDEREIVALAATWQSHHARQIEADLSTSSPEVFDDDPTMATGSDDDSVWTLHLCMPT